MALTGTQGHNFFLWWRTEGPEPKCSFLRPTPRSFSVWPGYCPSPAIRTALRWVSSMLSPPLSAGGLQNYSNGSDEV